MRTDTGRKEYVCLECDARIEIYVPAKLSRNHKTPRCADCGDHMRGLEDGPTGTNN